MKVVAKENRGIGIVSFRVKETPPQISYLERASSSLTKLVAFFLLIPTSAPHVFAEIKQLETI